MKPQKFTKQFAKIFDMAIQLSVTSEADAILVILDGPTDCSKLREHAGEQRVLVAADLEEELEGAQEFDLAPVVLEREDAPVFEKLAHALL